MSAHPNCTKGHTCQAPSGRTCIEADCNLSAGTKWGPYWCPDHDRDRLNRVSASMDEIAASFDAAEQEQGE